MGKKLNVDKLIDSAVSCLGWPYVSPGSNDENGIDCSGLFVKSYRDQDAWIYHGSNTIFHNHCSSVKKISSKKDLRPGMAVFKLKPWTDADKDNKWYGTPPGNLYHIGMVTSINPLVITHATPPKCTQDKKIGSWAYCGYLKDVMYPDGTTISDPAEMEADDDLQADAPATNKPAADESGAGNDSGESVELMTVWANNGKSIHMRARPTKSCKLYDDVPCGAEVEVVVLNYTRDKYGNPWSMVNYGKRKGWFIMTDFLGVG